MRGSNSPGQPRSFGRLRWSARAAFLALALRLLGASTVRADELDLSPLAVPVSRPVTMWIEDPRIPAHGSVQLGLALDYSHRVLPRAIACDAAGGSAECSSERDLVSDLARAEASLAVALFEAFELGVAVPVVLARAAPDVDQPLAWNAGFGDVRMSLGVPLSVGFATQVAAWLSATLPTASAGTWSGAGAWSVMPALIVAGRLARTSLAAKLGYQLRERRVVFDIEQDDQFVLQLGAALAATRAWSITTDVGARLGVGGQSLTRREVTLEIDVGARLRASRALSLELALGTNALPLDAAGFVPALRAVLIVRGTIADGCEGSACGPAQAAVDSDFDGRPDDSDVCPDDPEDRDGFADDDGCPDPDNDADGWLDPQDGCPERSEDRDGFGDSDGCPEPDDDEDGVADGADRCRRDPEDRDGFEDDDGCPEAGPARPVVTVSGSRILLSENVYFEGQSDVLGAPSVPVLDELARTLKKLGPHRRVRVEGHTDDAGNPDHNIDLSYRRAKAVVEFLKARGVPASQLEYVGYGATRPLADNHSEEGRAMNRRVQFVLVSAPP